MMRFFIAACVFTLLTACGNENTLRRDVAGTRDTIGSTAPLEFYTYGLPGPHGDRIHNTVGRRWGFTYRAVAGCEVAQELLDSVERHNRMTEEVIVARHGKDWRLRYEAEVARAYELDSAINKAALDHPFLIAAQDSLQRHDRWMYFEQRGLRADGKLAVDARYTVLENGMPVEIVAHRLAFDTATRTLHAATD